MSSSDAQTKSSDAARRERKRTKTLLLILAIGFLVFGAAAGALYYGLRPTTLRIAVGPPGSNDHKVIEAMSEAFASESRTVRLTTITTRGTAEALALLGAGRPNLRSVVATWRCRPTRRQSSFYARTSLCCGRLPDLRAKAQKESRRQKSRR